MQFSLFGAAVLAPVLADLEGVLLAGGLWVRTTEADGAASARLSVVVEHRWRAEALIGEFAERGVDGEVAPAQDCYAARTSFSTVLVPLAQAWTRGATQQPPESFVLTPGALRLWTIAAGRSEGAGFLLGTPESDERLHRIAGSQLARLGLAAVSAGRGGSGWRIISVKRKRRLAELIGEPPPGAEWPQ
jgi:hypothetical protein